ncbi:MAG: dTDP-4-dehydrorhamnose reductase [Janthinobacterium lividum]
MASSTRILITGKSGQVGGALAEELGKSSAEVLAPSSAELDLGSEDAIRNVVRKFRPQWIVNAAAYTAVDKAESEQELAERINTLAPRILADEAALLGAPLLHFSTDYVFDGTKPTPYVESDPTAPLNTYGRTKRAGEEALEQSSAPYLVFRTSWVYGATGKNFLRTILKAARERDVLRIVADQHGAPTWSRDLARMVVHVIAERTEAAAQQGCSVAETVNAVRGIYHAAGRGETTWFGFAEAGVNSLRDKADSLADGSKIATLEPISTAAYPTPAPRPLNSRLDCTKLQNVLGWSMQTWQDSLKLVLAELDTQ